MGEQEEERDHRVRQTDKERERGKEKFVCWKRERGNGRVGWG